MKKTEMTKRFGENSINRSWGFILLFILSISSTLLNAQEKISHSEELILEQWHTKDIVFNVAKNIKSPIDIVFGAVFIHESGCSHRVSGFYNDNSEFILRFSLLESGKWHYTTYSSHPELSNLKAEIIVSKNTKPDRHGPVCISETDKQQFTYSDGTSYFSMSYELDWLFALDYENDTDIPNTKELLTTIKNAGFNQVVMNVFAYSPNFGTKDLPEDENFNEPEAFPFGGTNNEPDHSIINIEYFKKLDRVINYLNEQEIIAHIMIYVWNKNVSWPESNSIEDNRYFDYVIKRYQGYQNIIWDISKEALVYGHADMDYITSRIKRLRELCGHERLITVHDYKYCSQHPEMVDFISIQHWAPNLYDKMIQARNSNPNKPINNIEHGGYEKTMPYILYDGAYIDAKACLDRFYQCVFAGSYATYYWQNTSWHQIISQPLSLPKDKQPSYHYYKYLSDFFKKYDYNKLIPVQYGYSPYCLTNSDDLFIYYVPVNLHSVTGNNEAIAQKTVKLTWFDPHSGTYTLEEKQFMRSSWHTFDRPNTIGLENVILVVEIL